ncbi:MAG: TRAP transporter small permease [Phreatobacter sp.]|uniref:TRAP transporter small permease subunit n=1 Tax=Phreatobacter sp. TaxID=1966341 RepID=UPI001A5117E3|nr:TRAP transporter small permease [Phreatobacter sp.]MBL8569561.1 TRAP transporter small permease [Phreatobacter sp.]
MTRPIGTSDGGDHGSPPDAYNAPQPLGFHRLTRLMNAVGTAWIFVMMLLMTFDVLGRNLFNTPIRGVIEIVTLSIVSIVFLQLADTLRTGQFTRADALLSMLIRRKPVLGRALQGLFHLVGAILIAVLCWASWFQMLESWGNGEYLGAIGDFQAPVWLMRMTIVFGSACTALTFLFLAVDDFRVASRRGAAS